jgi:hypothetical protein
VFAIAVARLLGVKRRRFFLMTMLLLPMRIASPFAKSLPPGIAIAVQAQISERDDFVLRTG